MVRSQCPVCYSPVEVRDVTPCFVCGGWPEPFTRINRKFTAFRLPTGRHVVLCGACLIEEFMVAGGWGYQLIPNEKLPSKRLQQMDTVEPRVGPDKFCSMCNLRLAFAEIISEQRHSDLDAAPNPASP